MKKIAFIYGKACNAILEQVKQDPRSLAFEYIDFETFTHQEMKYEKVLFSGDIDEIKAVFFHAIRNNFEVAIIPDASQLSLQESFSLSKQVSVF